MKPIPDELFPWNVSTIEEFLYYCCPECDLKTKNHETFLKHAVNSHKKAEKAFGETSNNVSIKAEKEDFSDICDTPMDYLSVEMKPQLNFQCYACETYFETHETLMEHVSQHKQLNSVKQCLQCCETFTSHVLHMDHLARSHFKPMNFKCDYCDYSSNLLFELKQHKQTKHSSAFKKPDVPVPKKAKSCQNKPKTWECYACGITKSNEHDLMEHVLHDHKKARGAKKCLECDKTFQKHILLLEHLAKVHEKEMRFYCDYCDAHTKTLNVLKQHKRREHSMEIVKENSDPQSIATTSGEFVPDV